MRYKNLKRLNIEISKLIILKTSLENDLKEIDASILKANHFHELPPDTSKLHDESIISLIERKDKIYKKIEKINKEIDDLKSHIDSITKAIDNMPDCFFKEIMDLFFLKSKPMPFIVSKTGYSRSSIYNVIKMKGGDY